MKPPLFELLSFAILMCVVARPQQEVPPAAEAPLPAVRYCPVEVPGETPTRLERGSDDAARVHLMMEIVACSAEHPPPHPPAE